MDTTHCIDVRLRAVGEKKSVTPPEVRAAQINCAARGVLGGMRQHVFHTNQARDCLQDISIAGMDIAMPRHERFITVADITQRQLASPVDRMNALIGEIALLRGQPIIAVDQEKALIPKGCYFDQRTLQINGDHLGYPNTDTNQRTLGAYLSARACHARLCESGYFGESITPMEAVICLEEDMRYAVKAQADAFDLGKVLLCNMLPSSPIYPVSTSVDVMSPNMRALRLVETTEAQTENEAALLSAELSEVVLPAEEAEWAELAETGLEGAGLEEAGLARAGDAEGQLENEKGEGEGSRGAQKRGLAFDEGAPLPKRPRAIDPVLEQEASIDLSALDFSTLFEDDALGVGQSSAGISGEDATQYQPETTPFNAGGFAVINDNGRLSQHLLARRLLLAQTRFGESLKATDVAVSQTIQWMQKCSVAQLCQQVLSGVMQSAHQAEAIVPLNDPTMMDYLTQTSGLVFGFTRPESVESQIEALGQMQAIFYGYSARPLPVITVSLEGWSGPRAGGGLPHEV